MRASATPVGTGRLLLLLGLSLAVWCVPASGADNDAAPEVQYLTCLERFHSYAETIWHDAKSPPDSGYFGDGASGGNGGIRGTCGVMVAYATLLRAGKGDREQLLGRIRAGLRYAALTHATGTATCVDGKQWGGSWQSSLWAGSLGFAAALVQENLEPELVAACKRVVAFEADRLASIPPPSGYRGDSKAEENAWNSNSLALAAAWMPDDERAPVWVDGAKRYLANTYTVPDAEADPLASWISTVTLYPSFMCENHGFFHPSYQMVSGMSLGDSLLMATALNPEVARELQPFAEHNVLPVWGSLNQVLLDSGELAYPSGLDWALHGYGQVSYYAWLGNHFDDPLGRWAERRLAGHLAYRQAVSGDGRFTGESVADGFYREAVMARRTAFAWWHNRLSTHPDGPVEAPANLVMHMPDVKLVLQRSANGFVSLSYGAKIMAMVLPESRSHAEEPYVVTPRFPGLIGRGALGAPTRAELMELEMTGEGFDATLRVQCGPLGSRLVRLVSYGDAVAMIEAPEQELLGGSGKAVAAFPLGIENHALTGGSRDLVWSGGGETVEAMSGKTVAIKGKWVCVSGRIGMIVGPEGTLSYAAASRYNRRGAAEDDLHFEPGAAGSPRFAVLLPGCDAGVTESVAGTVDWQIDESGARLSFRSPDGTVRTATLACTDGQAGDLSPIPAAGVLARSQSPDYRAELTVDGDATSFWVSSRDGAVPGHGPTSETPEWLEFRLGEDAQVDEIIIVPRTNYGPKQVVLSIDGKMVYEGAMRNEPLRVKLPGRIPAGTVRLTMLSSYDPLFPKQPRNVQVAEVLFLKRTTGEPE